jgi:peptidoglycan/LPS O-acetylase OafA/YrhL
MKKIWFKAKRYGWGWYPATWQGWTVIAIYLVIFFILATIFETNIEKFWLPYLISVCILTSLLVYISYKTGEKPGWRWGDKK